MKHIDDHGFTCDVCGGKFNLRALYIEHGEALCPTCYGWQKNALIGTVFDSERMKADHDYYLETRN